MVFLYVHILKTIIKIYRITLFFLSEGNGYLQLYSLLATRWQLHPLEQLNYLFTNLNYFNTSSFLFIICIDRFVAFTHLQLLHRKRKLCAYLKFKCGNLHVIGVTSPEWHPRDIIELPIARNFRFDSVATLSNQFHNVNYVHPKYHYMNSLPFLSKKVHWL